MSRRAARIRFAWSFAGIPCPGGGGSGSSTSFGEPITNHLCPRNVVQAEGHSAMIDGNGEFKYIFFLYSADPRVIGVTGVLRIGVDDD